MADNYCSQRFKTGEELDEALAAALTCRDDVAKAEAAAKRAEDAAEKAESAEGTAGKDGVSPTVEVSDIDGGHRLTITDAAGPKSVDVLDGKDGRDGADGYTPVKGVDYFDGKNGVDGKDGYTPIKGVDYFDGVNGKDGKDGYTPVKGVDYFDGQDGKDGKDGVDGYTPVKGRDYFDGEDGQNGAAGTSVTVQSVSESTDDGGSNIVTFSDGKQLTVKNGSKGSNGKDGKDYVLTDADKQEIAGLVGAVEIPNYWQEVLDAKCSTIKGLQDAGGKDCFSFVIMSDIHYPSNLGKRSPLLARYLMDNCDIKFALCLGDTQTRGCHATKDLLLAENKDIDAMFAPIKDRLLRTQGNHDGNYGLLDRDGNGKYNNDDASGNLKPTDEKETYVYSLTPGEMHSAIYRKVGLVGDCHFDTSGTGYWIDDVSNKVRYIVLNTQNTEYKLQDDGTAKYPPMWVFRFTQSQFDLTIEALNTVPSDAWAVVVAGHCPLWQEIGDANLMKGVLAAYKAKDTYSGEYEGTAAGGAAYKNLAEPLPDNTTDTSKWVNGYRFGSGGTPSAQSGTSISNSIACKTGDVIRIKGVTLRENNDRVGVHVVGKDALTYTVGYFQVGVVAGEHNPVVFNGLKDGVYTFTISSWGTSVIDGFRFAMPTPADASTVIITVNEEIVESAHGYDYVSVDCDFSNAKGKLVGYFAGHNHLDNAVVQYGAKTDDDHGFMCIATRCDAHEENDRYNSDGTVNTNGLWYKRDQAYKGGDLTQEQCFDVVTVNTKTKTIQTTRIGPGADRTISY